MNQLHAARSLDMANEAVGRGLGLIRTNLLDSGFLEQCDVRSKETRPRLKDSATAVYKYCTPSEWRRLSRGNDPNLPILPGTFPFMDLPAELRNEVYRELLLTTIPLQMIHDRPAWPDVSIPGRQLYPTILRTNYKVYHEALAILYGENTWYLQIDKTVVRYRADMIRLNSAFALPPPVTAHMSRITRIVMHAGSNDRTRTKYELYRQLLNAGIRLDNLQLFAMQFSDEYLLEKNKRVNVEWLEETDGKELAKKWVWFPDGTMADDGWLVMKKEKGKDGFVGLIPGLGII